MFNVEWDGESKRACRATVHLRSTVSRSILDANHCAKKRREITKISDIEAPLEKEINEIASHRSLSAVSKYHIDHILIFNLFNFAPLDLDPA